MNLKKLTALLMVELIILLPVSFAVVISDVTRVVTADDAVIEWKTDVETEDYVELSKDGVLVETKTDYQFTQHIVRFQYLRQNTFYDYKIYSKNDSDSDTYGGSFTTKDATPPEKVVGLRNISVGREHVALKWDISEAEDIDKYLIYRNGVNIANVTVGIYNDTNVSAGKTYTYRVSAVDNDGNEGDKSDLLSVKTPRPDLIPPVITNVRIVDMTDSSVKINWSTDELSNSEVYYRADSIEPSSKIIAELTLGHIVDISGLKKNDTLFYKVGSCDEFQNCINTSDEIKIKVGEDFESPTINVSIHDGMYYNDNHIEVKGNLYNQKAGTPESYSSIRVYVNKNFQGEIKNTGFEGTFDFGMVNLQIQEINVVRLEAEDIGGWETAREYSIHLDFEDPVLELEDIPEFMSNTSLVIKGSVSDNLGEVTLKFEYGLIESDITPPAIVEDFNATEISSVELTWTANTEDDFKEYIIYRNDIIIASTTTTKFADDNVSGGTTYTYAIAAVDKSCNIGEKAFVLINTQPSTKEEKDYNFTYDCVPEEALVEEVEEGVSGDFIKLLNLNKGDGDYTIRITAVDKAGNEIVVEKEINLDTKELEFADILPFNGAGFYRGKNARHAKITGTVTKPGAKIKIYVNKKTTDKADDSTTAKDDGSFTFKDVNLEEYFSGSIKDILTPKWIEQNTIEDIPDIENSAVVFFTATDATGKIVEHAVIYKLVTCWSGNLSFSHINLDGWQSPGWLSPERMQEGIELIAFAFELKYVGVGENFDIADVKIEPMQLDESMKDDPRYSYSIGLIEDVTPYVVSNEYKTQWFVRFSPLKPADYMTKFLKHKQWKSWFKSINNQLTFPYKVKIIATHEVRGKIVSANQEICEEVTYPVDNSRIDFSRLPKEMLYDFVDFLNKTSTGIGNVLEKMEPVIEIVGWTCIISFLTSLGIQIWRRLACDVGAAVKKLKKLKENGEEELCEDELSDKWDCTNKKHLGEMSDECLKKCSRACYGAWKADAALYKTYRWSCDRIFCHSSPARWTRDAKDAQTEGGLSVKLKKLKTDCKADQSAKGYPLVKRRDCKNLYNPDDGYNPYNRGKDCYKYTSGDETAKYVITEGAKLLPGAVTVTLKRADLDDPGTKIRPPSELTAIVVDRDGDQLLAPQPFTCKALCDHYGFDKKESKCMVVNDCLKIVNDQDKNMGGGPFGFTSGESGDKPDPKPNKCFYEGNVAATVGDDPDLRKECCCLSRKGKGPGTDYFTYNDEYHPDASSYKDMKFNYRLWKTKPKGKTYDPRRYIAGRDVSACFGANSLIEALPWNKETIPVLDPKTQHTSAIQCVCLTGIYNRLKAIKHTMEQIMSCLIQVRTTGELDAGVCKRIFSQYVCSGIWSLIQLFRNRCSPRITGVGVEKESGEVWAVVTQGTMEAIWGSVGDKADELMSEYGNAKLNEMLGGGEEAIARKICLSAFGIDFPFDFKNIMDAAYSTTYMSNVHALVPTREYLTFNPENGQPTYEYRANWFINPGCDIKNYRVYLVCVTNKEQNTKKGINCARVGDKINPYGCDCVNVPGLSEEVIIAPFNPGGETPSLRQGEPHSMDHSDVLTTVNYRADHLKIVLDIDSEYKKDCLPEGYSEGEFYFPIKDKTPIDLAACTVDSRTGMFSCSSLASLWSSRGTVGFVDIVKPTKGDIYYEGYPLVIRPIIYREGFEEEPGSEEKSGPNQCLLIDVKTLNGAQVIFPQIRDVSNYGTFDYGDITIMPSVKLVAGGGVPIPKGLGGDVISHTNQRQINILLTFEEGHEKYLDKEKEKINVAYGAYNIGEKSPDKLTIEDKTKTLIDWEKDDDEVDIENKEIIIKHRDVELKIWSVELKKDEEGNPEKTTYTVTVPAAGVGVEKEVWIVTLSLHHLKESVLEENPNARCTKDTADLSKPAKYEDIKQEMPIRIEVRKQGPTTVRKKETKLNEEFTIEADNGKTIKKCRETRSYPGIDLTCEVEEDKKSIKLKASGEGIDKPKELEIQVIYTDDSSVRYEVTVQPGEEEPVAGGSIQ